jgi:hypothetical protein
MLIVMVIVHDLGDHRTQYVYVHGLGAKHMAMCVWSNGLHHEIVYGIHEIFMVWLLAYDHLFIGYVTHIQAP